MPQYPFIFIGSILAILSINIGCKSPDSSSKSRLQGKKNESLNQTPLENTLNIKLHNFPNIMAVNSKSGFFYAETERNIYLEDKALNEIRKIVRGVINKIVK
jgi:hypothetical protein